MSDQVKQEMVKFYNDEILTFEQNGKHYVALKPICEYLGTDWSAQLKRIKEDDLFSSTMVKLATVAGDDKQREMVSLPVERFPFWLATIIPNHFNDADIRAKVRRYREEAADVVFEHFFISKQKAYEREVMVNYPTLKQLTELQREYIELLRPRLGTHKGKLSDTEKQHISDLYAEGHGLKQIMAITRRSESCVRKFRDWGREELYNEQG